MTDYTHTMPDEDLPGEFTFHGWAPGYPMGCPICQALDDRDRLQADRDDDEEEIARLEGALDQAHKDYDETKDERDRYREALEQIAELPGSNRGGIYEIPVNLAQDALATPDTGRWVDDPNGATRTWVPVATPDTPPHPTCPQTGCIRPWGHFGDHFPTPDTPPEGT